MKRGDKFEYRGGTAKVMAVADGWVMARKPYAAPFVVSEAEIIMGQGLKALLTEKAPEDRSDAS